MNEIKDLIIKILEEAPDLAIWILVILYGYKIVVVGSVYVTIRFCVQRIAAMIENKRKQPDIKVTRIKEIGIDTCGCDGSLAMLLNDVRTYKKRHSNLRMSSYTPDYLHQQELNQLLLAWDEWKSRQNKTEPES